MDTITAAAPPPDSALPTPTPDPARPDAPQLRTLLLTDLVDSTMLVERLGDGPAAELFRAHDRIVLRLQEQWRGRLIDRSDGLLLLFERPIDGLGFALDYARGLRDLGVARGIDLKARAGLHVGEVLTWRNSDEAVRVGAKPLEVEGLAKPMAGRLMSMARPGQILLSAIAEPLAHRAARELGERGELLLWKAHGRWRFKGVPQAQEIFEVGEAGIAPLRSPVTSNKVWRDIPLWRRPAALAAEATVIAIVAVGTWFALKPQPAIAFGERDWVVVGDLRNLTGQPVLDESLEQAFRISLEQSRYVNVLSDLKARDTLARMRKPADTQIDRAIASEIAIRDGARAVILPTVSEVGGRVRVSAEVIDPTTQATVQVEMADGKSVASTLASIDAVTAELRQSFGESVEAIDRDSVPLPQVTTSNLDALRAYALGQRAYQQGQFQRARQLFGRATRMDTGFALAWTSLMRVGLATEDRPFAQASLAKAIPLATELPQRERLYIEAWRAEFERPHQTLESWEELADLYPDYFPAAGNLATKLYELNRFDEAVRVSKHITVPQYDLAAQAYDILGRSEMALGDYPNAEAAFARAASAGFVLVARRQFALAASRGDLALDKRVAALDAKNPFNTFEQASYYAAKGRLAYAASLLEVAKRRFTTEQRIPRGALTLSQASVSLLADDPAEAAKIAAGYASRNAELRSASLDEAGLVVVSGLIAARAGDRRTAARLLQPARKLAIAQYRPLAELTAVADAWTFIHTSQPEKATALLAPFVDGTERFQTRVALWQSTQKSGAAKSAEQHRQWLARHMGRAYSELGFGQSLMLLNVADASRARAPVEAHHAKRPN